MPPGRWRAGPRQTPRSQRVGRLVKGLALLAVAIIGAAVVVGILVAPLFRWQTAAISLLIDQYELGTIEPVPYGNEDRAAFDAALTGRLGTPLGSGVLHLTGLESAVGLRELLLPRMKRLDVRPKDVMIAYIRGQAIVATPTLLTEGDTTPDRLAGRACFLAGDLTISGQRPRELVPVRDVVEAIGAAPPYTTLHVVDLGDVAWEPRLGVLANVVPRVLDEDFAAPQRDASYHNYVLGSHDLFQQSSVTTEGGRTYFSRAVELGLAGGADEQPWGDGDGMIELHELVPYAKAWTSEWVRRASNGRVVQTPVLWKLGVGRISTSDLPRDVPLVRVARPQAAKKTTPAAESATADGAREPAGTPAPPPDRETPGVVKPAPDASPAAPPRAVNSDVRPTVATADVPPEGGTRSPPGESTPDAAGGGPAPQPKATPADDDEATGPSASTAAGTPAPDERSRAAGPLRQENTGTQSSPPAAVAMPATPPPPADAWEALDRFGDRGRVGTTDTRDDRATSVGPVVVDVAPHVWARLFAMIASADVRREATGPLAERGDAAFKAIGADLASLWVNWSAGTNITAVRVATSPAIRLQAVLARADEDGFRSRWRAAPSTFTRALAARNDAIVALRSIIEIGGKMGGGASTPPIDPLRISTLLDKVTELTTLIRRTTHTGQTATGVIGLDPLSSATRSAVTETTIAVELLQGVIRSLIPEDAAPRQGYGFEAWIAALRSPVIGVELRDRIRRRLGAMHPAHAQGEPPTAGRSAGVPDEILPQVTGPVPAVVELDDEIDRRSLEFISSRALEIAGLAAASIGLDTAEAADLLELRSLGGDMAAVRRAAADLVRGPADRKAAIGQIVALGGLVAQLESRVAAMVDVLRNQDGTSRRTLDDVGASLLRVLDSRDVQSIDRPVVAGMPDWMPRVRAELSFESQGEPRLSLSRPLAGRLVVAGDQPPPPDAVLRMSFDPADVRVVLDGGREVRSLEPLPAKELPFTGGALGLRIVANRDRTTNERSFVILNVALESATRSGLANIRLELPARRDVAVGVRRTPTGSGKHQGAWQFATRGDRPASQTPDTTPTAERLEVELLAMPGATTGWEIAVENRADIARSFVARLFSLPVEESVNSQAGRTRTTVWSDFCAAIEAGNVMPEPVSMIEKLAIDPQSDPVVVVFPPPKPKAELPPPQSAAGSPQTTAPPPPIGPDFALVLDETTPDEPRRSYLVRLKLAVEHPRRRLRATATWKRDERIIAVGVEPTEAAGLEALPKEGLHVALEPLLSAPLTTTQPLSLRRAATVLTQARPKDVLTATWQGSDTDARAWLSVSVNGYPRAFVFVVDCSAAADGIVQEPQQDYRAIVFSEPRPAVPPALRAPADAIPMTLLVDAPPDIASSGARENATGGDPIVSLAFRSVRAGGMMAEGAQTVWTAAGDRRVTYTAQPPVGSTAVAVRTEVTDWSIAPTGEGYVDLDLVAEATLASPGMMAPLKDTRTFVMDGRAPKVEVPPLVNATIGRRLTVPVHAVDDQRESFALAPGTHIPGVSGVARVEWALDLKGDGAPETWTPAVSLGGGSYEVRVDTLQLPPGLRVPLLVRATDRVGLAHPPSRTWIETSVAVAKGQINGRVVLQNRGERNVLVRIDGPNAPPPQRSGADGAFTFRDLDPGTYTLKAAGPVRNRSYTSEATPAVVTPPPAPAPNVTLELK